MGRPLHDSSSHISNPNIWWVKRRNELLSIAEKESPRYVYELDSIRSAIAMLQTMESLDRIHYAVKANSYAPLLQTFANHSLCFDCVSLAEIDHVRALTNIDYTRILFTPNFAPIQEYAKAFEYGCLVTLDNLYLLEQAPELFRNRKIFVRIDINTPSGHHRFVRTSGKHSKFGIACNQIPQLLLQTKKLNISVIGLHAHVGSGILKAKTWANTAKILAKIAHSFPKVRILDLGGGFGVRSLGQKELNIRELRMSLQCFKNANPHFELWVEPGRFLVADAGVLLSRVTQIKHKSGKTFVGLDTGMNSLIRYPLYGAYHLIVNLSRLHEKPCMRADLVGPICESGDVLGHNRLLPKCTEGDIMLIATTGAYGHAMSSTYNLRPPANEMMID